MRILVVGATGFVGGHLLAECRERGDTLSGTFRPGEQLPMGDGVSWHGVEVLDSQAMDAALAATRPEGIVYLAGQANVALGNRDPVNTFRINAEGTLRMLGAMDREAPDARIIVVTSAEVYGVTAQDQMPVKEDAPLSPRTPYGVSKAAADLAAAQASGSGGLDVIRIRPFNHVGPGQRRGFVVPDFASQIAAIEVGQATPELKVGNLSARRDFTDVRDIVRGYREALDHGKTGEVYNLCSGHSVAIDDLVRELVDRASVDIRIVRDESRLRPSDVPEFRGDPTRAQRDFGWKATIPLERSLTDVLEEWRRAARSSTHLPD
ncbi:MAG: GDP-mannose 4,6-dehydratase [Gemmatimonadota bacterium]|nr:MAG: GDP-mannose 4,6-dehydratase [Gemmatimonadota bacterium]